MKWFESAKPGAVVVGDNGWGSNMNQLKNPRGVVTDGMRTVYVVDAGNNRIVRWPRGATEGSEMVGVTSVVSENILMAISR